MGRFRYGAVLSDCGRHRKNTLQLQGGADGRHPAWLALAAKQSLWRNNSRRALTTGRCLADALS